MLTRADILSDTPEAAIDQFMSWRIPPGPRTEWAADAPLEDSTTLTPGGGWRLAVAFALLVGAWWLLMQIPA
jgi:hypothetical protein